ncbi:MAG: hypothetical protein NDJ90_16020 [Oligoflexia bacterium]|nr:hypothetical protein [Oligoflexia bacterium]
MSSPLLSKANELLTQGLNYRTTLQRLAELALPALATHCVIEESSIGGEMVLIAVAPANASDPSAPRQPEPARLPLLARGKTIGWITFSGAGQLADFETMRSELALRCSLALVLGRAHEEFVSQVAHKVRTPLTPLLLQSRLIRRTLEKPSPSPDDLQDALKMLTTIDEQVQRLSTLINQLADKSLPAS